MDFTFENVTLRKKNVSLSNTSMESFETSASEYLARSLPDLSALSDNINKELREEIINLRCQLDSAHKEIESLILENNSLNKVNKEQAKTIEILTQITKNIPSRKSFQNKTYKICSTPKNQQKSNKILINASTSQTPNTEDTLSKSLLLNEIATQNEDNLKSKSGKKSYQYSTNQDTISAQKNKILILGDQQLRGLSTELLKYKADQYSVLSFIKPNAKTSEILQNFNDNSNLCNKDFAILSIGMNDRDPYSVLTHLCNTLEKFKKCKQVFLLKIKSSRYLNVGLLNYKLNLIVKQYNNCTFVDLDTYLSKYKHCTHKTYIKSLYNKLKIEMDYQEYKNKFLTFSHKTNINLHNNENKIKQLNKINMTYNEYKQNLEKLVANRMITQKSDKPCALKIKKGTIPYYFSSKLENKKENIFVSNGSVKKGTIPYYFSIKSVNASKNSNNNSQFFRK